MSKISKSIYLEKQSKYYRSCRWDIIEMIPDSCQKILDVGCGEGVTGKAIKELRPKSLVYGIEYNQDAAYIAIQVLDGVIIGDVETLELQKCNRPFDCIIMGDILEHLVDPWHTLYKFSKLLKENGYTVISIPNIQHFSVILGLIKGNWSYQDRGILDRSHLRFFTRKEVIKLIKQARLVPEKIKWNIRLKEQTRAGSKYTTLLTRFFPFLRQYFVFQYIILATYKKVTLDKEKYLTT